MDAPEAGADVDRQADAESVRAPPDETRTRELVDEQAALRRVATLVAGGARQHEVFTAVADELSHLIGAEATFVSRVDHSSGDLVVVGSYGQVSDKVPIGFRLELQPEMVQAIALRTGRPARTSGERLARGPHAAWVATLGMRAGVATPIVVGGRPLGRGRGDDLAGGLPGRHRGAHGRVPGARRDGRSPTPGPSRSCASWRTPRRRCGAWPCWSRGANRLMRCSRP